MCDALVKWIFRVFAIDYDDDYSSDNEYDYRERRSRSRSDTASGNSNRGGYSGGAANGGRLQGGWRKDPFKRHGSSIYNNDNNNNDDVDGIGIGIDNKAVQLNKTARLAISGRCFLIKLKIERNEVFAYVIDGYFMFYSREIPKYKVGDPECRLGLIELTGATAKMETEGSSFRIVIRTHEDIVVEFDFMSVMEQNNWFHAVGKEIEDANINMAINEGGIDSPNVNKGVVQWYTQMMRRKKASLINVRQEVVMIKHYVSLGTVKHHQRIMYMDDKAEALAVCWRDPRESKLSTNVKSILIDDIMEIVEGNLTAALSAQTSSRNKSSIAQCWAIVGNSEYVAEFEAPSIGEKERWVASLKELVKIRKVESLIDEKVPKRRRGVKNSSSTSSSSSSSSS